MQIRWSSAASEDFFHIVEFIRRENDLAALRVA
jgi:plasmid stabilization system protein ParE